MFNVSVGKGTAIMPVPQSPYHVISYTKRLVYQPATEDEPEDGPTPTTPATPSSGAMGVAGVG